jgi:hypothetical protein
MVLESDRDIVSYDKENEKKKYSDCVSELDRDHELEFKDSGWYLRNESDVTGRERKAHAFVMHAGLHKHMATPKHHTRYASAHCVW